MSGHHPEFGTAPEAGAMEDQVRGERGAPAVSRTQSLQSRLSSVLAAALMLVVGCGMLFWYYTGTLARRTHVRQAEQAAVASRAQAEMPLPALGRIEAPVTAVPADVASGTREAGHEQDRVWEDSPGLLAPPLQPAVIPDSHAGISQLDPLQLALQRRLSGAVFVRDSQLAATGSSVPRVYGSGRGSAETPTTSGEQATARTPSTAQASVLPELRFLLPKGAFIDCTLETAIDSTLPGMTTCITATDTFSADGRVVLLERGTKLIGETQGQVEQGAARIFVLWSEARTPAGVVVPLASPGADELGRAGLPGKVNRHFMDRFGAAILLSVIDGAVQSAVQSSNRSGAVVLNPSGSRDVLAEVLRSTVNIRPTVVKRHGDRIQVLVARDLDFRSVYELRSLAAVRR